MQVQVITLVKIMRAVKVFACIALVAQPTAVGSTRSAPR